MWMEKKKYLAYDINHRGFVYTTNNISQWHVYRHFAYSNAGLSLISYTLNVEINNCHVQHALHWEFGFFFLCVISCMQAARYWHDWNKFNSIGKYICLFLFFFCTLLLLIRSGKNFFYNFGNFFAKFFTKTVCCPIDDHFSSPALFFRCFTTSIVIRSTHFRLYFNFFVFCKILNKKLMILA